MVNNEILGGLRSARNKGESLQKSMMSLYNSGYKKEEIEEAARALNQEKAEAPMQMPIKKEELVVPEEKKIKPLPALAKPSSEKVSAYEEPKEEILGKQGLKKKAGKGMKMILIILALLAIGLGILFLLSNKS